jgi:hypothetical protein
VAPAVALNIGPSSAEETFVSIEGDINEHATFPDIPAGARVVLYLRLVHRINSEGMRRFDRFLRKLDRRMEVVAECCSPTVVAQLNLLPHLTRTMRVRSVVVPFECLDCRTEGEVRVHVGARGEGRPEFSAPGCPECGNPMVLSDLEERYFAFLAPLDLDSDDQDHDVGVTT